MDSDAPAPRLLTQAEVAKRLRVTVRTIYSMRAAGELANIPGRPVRIPEDQVDAYIDRQLVQKVRAAEDEARRRAAARDEQTRRRLTASIAKMTPDARRKLLDATYANMGRSARPPRS